MRKSILFFILCFLAINCTEVKAQTTRRHHHHHLMAPKKDKVIKQELPVQELRDSLCLKDSLDSLDISKNFKEVTEEFKLKGTASWYSYRGGLFAASTKFKKGSVLRVTNPANKKSVTVVVNDYGPSKKKHPNRVLDLDKVAYKKIAPLGTGLVKIIVYPLIF